MSNDTRGYSNMLMQANDSMINKTLLLSLAHHSVVPTTYDLAQSDSNMTTNKTVTEAVIILQYCGKAFGLVSLLLNVLFLCAMQLLEDRSSVTNRLMRHMSVADLLASASFLVTHTWPQGVLGEIANDRQLVLREGLPYVFRSLPWVFFSAYLLVLLTLTANHYVAVCKPWCYSRLFTARFISYCMFVVWFVSSLQVALPLALLIALCSFSNGVVAMETLFKLSAFEMQIWLSLFVVCTSVNIVLHCCVYLKIHLLRARKRQRGDANAPTHNVRSNKHDAFVTVSLLLLASVFSRLPFPVTGLVAFTIPDSMTYETWSHVSAVCVLLLYVTFFTDPIIYLLRVKELRVSYAKMVAALRCCYCPLLRKAARSGRTRMLYGQESMQMTSLETSIRQSVFSKQAELI